MPRIYTRTGDNGTAGLFGGKRVSKDSPRLWAYGTVDELNSVLGVARSANKSRKLDRILAGIQNDLFDLGAELASPNSSASQVQPQQVAKLEELIDELEADLPALTAFILPGGAPTGAALHVARTICRRAERYCVRLAHKETIGEHVIPYLNRLGDALFVLARWTNRREGARETKWQK